MPRRPASHALLLSALLFAPLPVAAQDLSASIAADGLAATEAELAALPTPTEADRFALGGLRFLRAVETTYQTRWRTGLDDPSGMVPLLRLEQGVSPAASSSPGDVSALFAQVATDMASARAPLAGLSEGPEFSVEIRLADLWFDVNADGTRTPDEDLMQLLGPTLMGWRWFDRDPAAPAPVIRFDRADAAWLSAYTHLLEGTAKIILAYDPTDAITRAASARTAMQAISPPYAEEIFVIRPWVDALWVMLDALDQQPDAARLAQARDHFLAMIADNRAFWTAVEKETDNDAEWLPNARQTSALGLTLPPETGLTWLAVLADGEALLKGEKLIPYWRLGDGGGVNLARMFTDPAPIDVKDWIQGTGALPYLEQGATVSADSWQRFEAMMGGDAMLMSVWLN
ncbi:hypothetical protein [Paragemmobacter ruber]|uniref:Uncharacterized protein n=1 Tax=Paragemmobacter ruber TaxID=1985673 RepID=A0ABW9Y3L6_9RHOB|nr:hypothetical protein [Rhodobacter ruber]NBE06529.1 hypothetical protein [Rhodobacter ruber]